MRIWDFSKSRFREKVNRARINQKKKDGGAAGGEFIKAAGEFEKGEQYPIVQRRFVVIMLAEKGGRDVVARKFHLQSHKCPDAFVVEKGEHAEVGEQCRQ